MRVLNAATLLPLVVCVAAQLCEYESDEWGDSTIAEACFRSVLFSDEVRDETIDMLQRGMQLFGFLDISNNSPELKFPMQVDLNVELEALRSQPFSDDLEFQEAVVALFAKLQDTHTRYRVPQCYRDIDFYQPFNLIGYVSDDGQHAIGISEFIDEEVRQHFEDDLNIRVSQYLDAEVLRINFVNATEFISQYAETHVAVTKDRNTRFNIALSRFAVRSEGFRLQAGYWGYRNLERSPVPSEATVTYELRLDDGSVETVAIPWRARARRDFTGIDDFRSACFKSTRDSMDPPLDLFTNNASPRMTKGWEDEMLYRRDGPKRSKWRQDAILLETSNNAELWQINEITAALTVDTFSPSNTNEFTGAISRMLQIARDLGLTQMVLDMTNNGGGNICLGEYLHNGFFPDDITKPVYDISGSGLSFALARRASDLDNGGTFWSGGRWTDLLDVPFNNTSSAWLENGRILEFGGRERMYSQLLRSTCSANSIDGGGYRAEKIILLTHGFCGSTCAVFSMAMRSHSDVVTTVAVGGYPEDEEMQYMSFPGGQVLESTNVFSTIGQLDMPPSEFLPIDVSTTASWRFAARNIYSPYIPSRYPAEFVFHPADVHLNNDQTSATYVEEMWQRVLPLFKDTRFFHR